MTASVETRLELRAYGRRAVLVEVADGAAARALASYVRSLDLPVVEVVTGASTVLLDGLDPALAADLVGLRRRLAAGAAQDAPDGSPDGSSVERPVVDLPVVWDGADLVEVAERWGSDVSARLGELTLTSAFCGFAPGFAYLEGLPAELAVPRLATPRTRVPAGSVALAGAWCGVYPSDSPGGWRLLGHTDVTLWDPDRAEPALLAPGTRVRFVPA